MTPRGDYVEIFRCMCRIQTASSSEEIDESWSDLERLGHASVGASIVAALAKIQLERPSLLPFALTLCVFGLWFHFAK
jgi:hypothetical protein